MHLTPPLFEALDLPEADFVRGTVSDESLRDRLESGNLSTAQRRRYRVVFFLISERLQDVY